MTLADQIRNIVWSAGFRLNPYAQAYLNALDEAEALYGEQGVRTQALYIANNLIAKTPEQKLALDQLRAIGYGEPIPTKPKKTRENVMTEEESSQISDAFERYTENLVNRLQSGLETRRDKIWDDEDRGLISFERAVMLDNALDNDPSLKLHMDVFKSFAEEYGYPLDKVLVAQPWIEEVLGEDVKQEINRARKIVRVEEG